MQREKQSAWASNYVFIMAQVGPAAVALGIQPNTVCSESRRASRKPRDQLIFPASCRFRRNKGTTTVTSQSWHFAHLRQRKGNASPTLRPKVGLMVSLFCLL